MIEDREFNAFLKAKLEENLEVPALKLPQVSRSSVVWRRALAMAAVLAVVCGLAVWQVSRTRGDADDSAMRAIDYLEALDGMAAVDDSPSDFADRLVAWQDAPYEELLN